HRTTPTVVYMLSEHVHRGATRNDRTSGRRSRFSSAPFQGWKSGDGYRAVRRCRGRSRRPTGARKPPVRGPGSGFGGGAGGAADDELGPHHHQGAGGATGLLAATERGAHGRASQGGHGLAHGG